MEPPIHSITALFDQLGLESRGSAIANFIQQHSPIPANVALPDAECWNPSQATFLKKMLAEDADWAEVVDQLSTMLR